LIGEQQPDQLDTVVSNTLRLNKTGITIHPLECLVLAGSGSRS
jgi:hypothetical protein